MKKMIINSIAVFVYFLILYFIAFFSNVHYREKNDFLFIKKSQWKAIVIVMIPVIIVLVKLYW
jgi:hypothetical protein